MRDEPAVALDESGAKREAEQVLAFDPLAELEPAGSVKVGHQRGDAGAARRAVDRAVAKDDEVSVPALAEPRVDQRGHHPGQRAEARTGYLPRPLRGRLDPHPG